jgi:hypothetical protein
MVGELSNYPRKVPHAGSQSHAHTVLPHLFLSKLIVSSCCSALKHAPRTSLTSSTIAARYLWTRMWTLGRIHANKVWFCHKVSPRPTPMLYKSTHSCRTDLTRSLVPAIVVTSTAEPKARLQLPSKSSKRLGLWIATTKRF